MVQDKRKVREPGCSVGFSLGQHTMVVHCIPLSVITISDCMIFKVPLNCVGVRWGI